MCNNIYDVNARENYSNSLPSAHACDFFKIVLLLLLLLFKYDYYYVLNSNVV